MYQKINFIRCGQHDNIMGNGKSISNHFLILDNLKEKFKWTDEDFRVGCAGHVCRRNNTTN